MASVENGAAFQSTLPCGSDPTVKTAILTAAEFQSTLPCGSDAVLPPNTFVPYVFQSTLPCGSDFHTIFESERLHDFNPRSLAGATLSLLVLIHLLHLFQSTLPCGSDSFHYPFIIPPYKFQSTLPCGSDSIKRKYFSFHLNQAFIAN